MSHNDPSDFLRSSGSFGIFGSLNEMNQIDETNQIDQKDPLSPSPIISVWAKQLRTQNS